MEYVIAITFGILIGGVIFFVFMPSANRRRQLNKPRLLWIYDFLNFRIMSAGWIVKLLYICGVCILTLYGLITLIGKSLLMGFALIALGNVVLRLIYEYLMMIFQIHGSLLEITSYAVPVLTQTYRYNEQRAAEQQRMQEQAMEQLSIEREQRSRALQQQQAWAARNQRPQYAAVRDTQPSNPCTPASTEKMPQQHCFPAATQGPPMPPGAPRTAAICPRCGHAVAPNVHFCAHCRNFV